MMPQVDGALLFVSAFKDDWFLAQLSEKTYMSTCWQLTPISIENNAPKKIMLAIACHLVQKLILGSKYALFTSFFFYSILICKINCQFGM
jgi:hypothetical protein